MHWAAPATSTECTLHQLAPYIGKLKSTIARDLVSRFSKPGDLVVDPFCGSGTIPLEGVLLGRRVVASDISSYAATLTKAKLSPPPSECAAFCDAEDAFRQLQGEPVPDLRSVPAWVRKYFHPQTLKETLAFARMCRRDGRDFLLACLLGILHHQRPGFLSFPSSHLVPYLRDKTFPKEDFPGLYEYRPLRPRLLAKIRRAMRRGIQIRGYARFLSTPVDKLEIGSTFDALITSPPYMNALDYGRDNRLRLWLLDEDSGDRVDADSNNNKTAFERQMNALARLSEQNLRPSGYSVLVVGESVNRSATTHPAQIVTRVFSQHAPSLDLYELLIDNIPDVRRARRSCRGVKREQIIVYKKRAH